MVSGEGLSLDPTFDPMIHQPSLGSLSPSLALQERRLALAFPAQQVMQPHVGFRLATHLGDVKMLPGKGLQHIHYTSILSHDWIWLVIVLNWCLPWFAGCFLIYINLYNMIGLVYCLDWALERMKIFFYNTNTKKDWFLASGFPMNLPVGRGQFPAT